MDHTGVVARLMGGEPGFLLEDGDFPKPAHGQCPGQGDAHDASADNGEPLHDQMPASPLPVLWRV